MKPCVKSKLVSKNCPTNCPFSGVSNIIPVLHTGYFYVLNLKNLCNNSLKLLMKFLLIFSLIVHEKSLDITDNKEKDFDDNINFCQCIPFLGKYRILNLKDWFGKKKKLY